VQLWAGTFALQQAIPSCKALCNHALLTNVCMASAVAVSRGAVTELLACCQAAASSPELPSLPEYAVPAARALTAVLASEIARDEFAEQEGPTVLKALLEKAEGQTP
jgi:hypothetical protein